MAKEKIILVVFLVACCISFLLFFTWKVRVNRQTNLDEFIEKIDSLDSKIDSIYIIRDSICEKIDTVYIKLEDNNKHYEKNVNRIINNNVNEDYVFFLNYINTHRARLDSVNSSL